MTLQTFGLHKFVRESASNYNSEEDQIVHMLHATSTTQKDSTQICINSQFVLTEKLATSTRSEIWKGFAILRL